MPFFASSSNRSALPRLLLLAGALVATASSVGAVTPPPPTPTAASCEVTVGNKCWVAGSFTLDSSSPGADHYRICRSVDTSGWAAATWW